ncbi:hypothetical protein PSAC2689_120237 [Paraburkholderia sacchari]
MPHRSWAFDRAVIAQAAPLWRVERGTGRLHKGVVAYRRLARYLFYLALHPFGRKRTRALPSRSAMERIQ